MKCFLSLHRQSKKKKNSDIYQVSALLILMIMYRWGPVQGFTVYDVVLDPTITYSTATKAHTTEMFATKKENSNNNNKSNLGKSNMKGGGFGRIVGPETDIDDDYRIFPPLESWVRGTLVSATSTDSTAPLSSEIYQRLDQIYGFPSFNYENSNISDAPISKVSPLDYLMNTDESDDELIDDDTSSKEDLGLQGLPPFNKIRVLHIDPMILSIDDFFTIEECDQYVQQSETKSRNGSVMESRSPTVGKDAGAKAQRTSTTFYHRYDNVPELVGKASRLLGVPNIDQWEEPQTVRYRRNEKFTWHLDALGPIEQQQAGSSGQRIATVLVYLTDLNEEDGGATLFRDLSSDTTISKYLRVQPKKGMALLFFPSANGVTDCPFDIRTLHCGEVVSNDASSDKWIAQLWLRQRPYTPTAPPGNRHCDAHSAIADFCTQYAMKNHMKS